MINLEGLGFDDGFEPKETFQPKIAIDDNLVAKTGIGSSLESEEKKLFNMEVDSNPLVGMNKDSEELSSKDLPVEETKTEKPIAAEPTAKGTTTTSTGTFDPIVYWKKYPNMDKYPVGTGTSSFLKNSDFSWIKPENYKSIDKLTRAALEYGSKNGIPQQAVLGLVSQGLHESNGDPGAGADKSNGVPRSFGLWQMMGPRAFNLLEKQFSDNPLIKSILSKHNSSKKSFTPTAAEAATIQDVLRKDPDTFMKQLNFVFKEKDSVVGGRGLSLWNKLMKNPENATPADWSQFWTVHYERPKDLVKNPGWRTNTAWALEQSVKPLIEQYYGKGKK